jgi:hypothetical protein
MTAGEVPDRFASEELSEQSCWELVSRSTVGRLAFFHEGRVHIFPVNFVVDGMSVVFRTDEGTKLSGSRRRQVSFEVDGFDPDLGVAWSVVLDGQAMEIVDADEWDEVRDLPLFPWHTSPKGHFVRVVAHDISGRRFIAPYAGSEHVGASRRGTPS